MTAIEPSIKPQTDADCIEEVYSIQHSPFYDPLLENPKATLLIWGVTRGAVSQRL